MPDTRIEFDNGNEDTGYFIVAKRSMAPRPEPRIVIMKEKAPPGTLAKMAKAEKDGYDIRIPGKEHAWIEPIIWSLPVARRVAENMLVAAKEKDGAAAHGVDTAGTANEYKVVVQRRDKSISLSEQFDAGIGKEVVLPVKTMKKLAEAILTEAAENDSP